MKKLLVVLFCVGLLACSKESDVNDIFIATDAEGCSDFGVYTFNSGKSVGIGIYGDKDLMELDMTNKSFDLSTVNPDHLSVIIKEFSKGGGRFSCGNLGGEDSRVVHSWTAESGTVSIQITDTMPIPDDSVFYNVNVTLQNVRFKHDRKNKYLTLEALELTNVTTGGNYVP